MVLRLIIVFSFLALLPSFRLAAQDDLRLINRKQTNYRITYEVAQNLIIIPVRINSSPPLRFVLDSGISNTIITELTGLDTLALNYARQLKISGLGDGVSAEAWYSTGNLMIVDQEDYPGTGIRGDSVEVFIMMDNRFELSQQLGIQVNGLLGSDFFSDFVVEIEPLDRYITFWDREHYNFRKIRKSFTPVPLTILNNKAYVDAFVEQEDGTSLTTRLLIDTGASLAMWIAPSADPQIHVPARTVKSLLGQGLSGDIAGVNGRVKQVRIGSHVFRHPIVSFPDSSAIAGIKLGPSRHGSLGNDILRRFTVIFDYEGRMMYLRPNKWFNTPFSYNRSGMDVEKPLPNVPIYRIYSVIPDSPSDQAGVKPGDLIEYINYLPVINLNLDDINNILHGEEGKTVRLRINRDGYKHQINFQLQGKI